MLVMAERNIAVISLFLILSNVGFISAKLTLAEAVTQQRDHVVHYTNSWAVRVTGGAQEADALATKHGLINRGQIGNQKLYYLFMEGDSVRKVAQDEMTPKTAALHSEEKVESVKQQVMQSRVKKEYSSPFDPGWTRQWSLRNTGQNGPPGLDLNVEPAWMQGVTGDGVTVGLVDDGMDWQHRDLIRNYDSSASHDFVHYDSDPTPDYDADEPNTHGTECAGVVGMSTNNYCGVGVAHDANIGSLKFDVESATDAVEALAVGYKDYYIDIYSNSWGPLDFGFIVSGPGILLQNTLQTGVTEGRGGKGSIYVWASGNGGRYFDSCAADGYSASIYTISVGSANQDGRQAFYDEDCPAKMAVTFSFNSDTFPSADETFDPYNQVYTTTLDNECTDGFTGTSASTPLVSGVIALALQANPDLTWRDVQYLLAYTSNPDILIGDDWITNGGGLKVSHHFGFGAVDAEAMVTRANHWINVPDQHTKTVYSSSTSQSGYIYTTLIKTFYISESSFTSHDTIASLEHVIVKMSLSIGGVSYYSHYDYEDLYDAIYEYYDDTEGLYDWLENPHPRRGDIKIELMSPQGTNSVLLPYRNYDFVNDEGYDNWPFMSVHFWGENPVGTWTLKITYKSGSGYVYMSGLSLTLYGTATVPAAVSSIPTTCDPSCARGCFSDGPLNCDSCQQYRVASTLECVDQCPVNTHAYKNYCYPTDDEDSTDDESTDDENVTEDSTSDNKEDSGDNNVLPVALGVSAVVVVLGATIVIAGGILFVVYKRKNREVPFIRMSATEVET